MKLKKSNANTQAGTWASCWLVITKQMKLKKSYADTQAGTRASCRLVSIMQMLKQINVGIQGGTWASCRLVGAKGTVTAAMISAWSCRLWYVEHWQKAGCILLAPCSTKKRSHVTSMPDAAFGTSVHALACVF
eukprot:1158773-Pelagomonas_calceolata.AAC.23